MMMLLLLLLLVGVFQSTATIDRQAVVERHTPTLTCSSWKSKECNPLDFQTLGNGALAFSVDVTGLQTFNATLQSGGALQPAQHNGRVGLAHNAGGEIVAVCKRNPA